MNSPSLSRFLFLFGLAFSLLVLMSSARIVSASSINPDDKTIKPQFSGEIELPSWEVGESREGFDIRIWPDEVVVWLEQEHLRDLIADPSTPEEERESLQQILAQQLAWKST